MRAAPNALQVNLPTVILAIKKKLLEGPEEIGIYLPLPTRYVFEITYSNPNPQTPVRIIDTVPAEFEILTLTASVGSAIFFDPSQGGGNSANRIEWDLPAAQVANLVVEIQTVASPGKGHKDPVYKPTQCGPLPINDGATAFEVDPVTGEIVRVEVVDPLTGEVTLDPIVIVGPSNALVVEAVDGVKPCEEVDEEVLGKSIGSRLKSEVPEGFFLYQNYPNPFNPESEIRFQFPQASHVVVRIFNTLGQEIRTLVEGQYEPGYHSVRWDSKDNNGKRYRVEYIYTSSKPVNFHRLRR